MACRPMRSRFSSTGLGLRVAWIVRRQDGVVEGLVGIVVEVAVGVALDHGQAARHAGVDALAR